MNPSSIRVKMCGMTRSEDIAHAVSLGVDAIGLVFYPKSARAVSIEQAKILLKDLPPFVDAVAVMVNPDSLFVQRMIQELPIQLLQFHGDETESFCRQFNKPFIKAIHAHSAEYIQGAEKEFVQAAALLLDTPSVTTHGGSGVVFNWQIVPKNRTKPYIVSGGLDEYNVLEAIQSCHPYAVDLCSGIEASPGIKDHGKMSRFMKGLINE